VNVHVREENNSRDGLRTDERDRENRYIHTHSRAEQSTAEQSRVRESRLRCIDCDSFAPRAPLHIQVESIVNLSKPSATGLETRTSFQPHLPRTVNVLLQRLCSLKAEIITSRSTVSIGKRDAENLPPHIIYRHNPNQRRRCAIF
jgi:hypothetical protein